jgi:hypothetical protein
VAVASASVALLPHKERESTEQSPHFVSLKSLAKHLDAHRSSVRRWLEEAGIRPVVLGRGRNGAIRYLWTDVERWLQSLERVR